MGACMAADFITPGHELLKLGLRMLRLTEDDVFLGVDIEERGEKRFGAQLPARTAACMMPTAQRSSEPSSGMRYWPGLESSKVRITGLLPAGTSNRPEQTHGR